MPPSKTLSPRAVANPTSADDLLPKRRGPGRTPNLKTEHPENLWDRRDIRGVLAAALDAEMKRHGDTAYSLHRHQKSRRPLWIGQPLEPGANQ